MKLQLASSGNQFSKIGHKTFSALACFMLMTVSNIKTVLSVSVAAFLLVRRFSRDIEW